MKRSGIYSIKIGDGIYIGSSLDLDRRLRQHKSDLKCNRHCNKFLQNSYNKHKKLEVSILEEMDNPISEELFLREKYFVNLFNPKFNIQDPETNFCVKRIYQFDLEGNLLGSFSSAVEASNILGIGMSNIQHAAQENKKDTKTAGGYLWSYSDSTTALVDNRHTQIHVYDISGKYIKSYNTVKETCEKLFPDRKYANSMINRICRNLTASFRGFRFSYEKVDQLDNSLLLNIAKNYPIVQLDYRGNEVIKVWENIKTAASALGVKRSQITDSILKNNRCNKYYWKKLGDIKIR